MGHVRVECYAGHRADERPLRFSVGDHTYAVERVDDKWYSPGETYFRVLANDGNLYVLKHDESADTWSIDAFRAPK
ncbi:MAG: hypothetical protein ACRD4H_06855 [Candidatus Acidiferrales bacterium]